jgi:hypothetical protein
MRRPLVLVLLSTFLLTSCATPTPAVTPQLVNAYATSAASPRLNDLYDCASSSVVVRLADEQSADISLRLGEPANLSTPAYQLGSEDILVVVHPQTGVGQLTLEQVHAVFLGQVANWKEVGGNDLPVEVWTFAPEEDVSRIFGQAVMNGQPVTSLARLAVSAQAMSDSVGTEPGSAGILPRRWKAGNTRDVFLVAKVPVLAITKSEPQGAVKELLACLQLGH